MFGTWEEINLYLCIPFLLVSILGIVYMILYKRHKDMFQWPPFLGKKKRKIIDEETIFQLINEAGFSYDPIQDIFYSNRDAWQRNMGYCRLYDEAAAPLNMIIDCEPIYFEYDGKKWMIEFWKGQYGMTTGGEIGIYSTLGPDLNIKDVFNGTFYHCAEDDDLLKIDFSLMKNGEILFTRKDKHWWVTGFLLGEFSEPTELSMDIRIILKDESMREAFVKGLYGAGYKQDEIIIRRNSVRLIFDKPRTPQPFSRIPQTDWVIQRKNKLLCDKYQEITYGYENFPDKIKAIQKQDIELYQQVFNIGKTRKLFRSFEVLKDYL